MLQLRLFSNDVFLYIRLHTECSEHVNSFIDAYWAHVCKRTWKKRITGKQPFGRKMSSKWFWYNSKMVVSKFVFTCCILLFSSNFSYFFDSHLIHFYYFDNASENALFLRLIPTKHCETSLHTPAHTYTLFYLNK